MTICATLVVAAKERRADEQQRPFLSTEDDVRRGFRFVSAKPSCWVSLKNLIYGFRIHVPVVGWIREYKLEWFSRDVWAGVSVAAASVPMGMSYARLAGVPATHGLYNVFFHTIIYLIFGSSGHIAVGVSAIESMLVADAVHAVVGNDDSPEIWLQTAISMGFFVGLTLLIFRVFRAGVIARFLADPVLSGFVTGSAVQIASSQLKDMLGVPLQRRHCAALTIRDALAALPKLQWQSFVVALGSMAIVGAGDFAQTKFGFPLPGSLLALLLGGGVSALGALPGVPTVGLIKGGFPSPRLFTIELAKFPELILRSVIYASLYFVIHVSVAKSFARKKGTALDTDQELLALGLTGIIGSFFQCFAPATSLSRSSLALAAGAISPLWMAWTASVLGGAMAILPPLLAVVPLPTLAGVVTMAVRRFTEWEQGLLLLKLKSVDSFLWTATMLSVIFGGSGFGILVGVGISVFWLLSKIAAPRTAILGRLPGPNFVYRDVKKFPAAMEEPGIKIIRFDASLNFANAEVFEKIVESVATIKDTNMITRFQDRRSFTTQHRDSMERENSNSNNNTVVAEYQHHGEDIEICSVRSHHNIARNDHESNKNERNEIECCRFIIIDASSVNDLDWTALQVLAGCAKRLKKRKQFLLFANWKGPASHLIERSGFYTAVPPEHCFLSLAAAVTWAAALKEELRMDFI